MPDAEPTLDDVLRTVNERVPYLGVRTTPGPNDERDWIGCAALIANGDTLETIVRDTNAGFETDDDAVAASLFAEAYAFRVAGDTLAAFVLGLPVPNTTPAATAVRLDKPRTSAVAYLDPRVHLADARTVAAEIIGAHLQPFVAAVHAEFRVGERLLWGNVAAACAVAFRAVESSPMTPAVERSALRARADEFFVASTQWFDGLGYFTIVETARRTGWYWNRTSCCLWFRTASGAVCDNCSLIDPTALYERRVDELRA